MIAWGLLGLIVALILSYGFLVNGIIANTVAAKDAQSRIGALQGRVAGLESAYLAAKSEITLDSALAMGFQPSSSDAVYVSRSQSSALTFNR